MNDDGAYLAILIVVAVVAFWVGSAVEGNEKCKAMYRHAATVADSTQVYTNYGCPRGN